MPKAKPPRTRLKPGEANFNSLFRKYQWLARKRNLPWDLTKAEFKTLTKKHCFYCGVSPKQVQGGSSTRRYGDYIYNGIDRADSLEGYTVGNCRPCCGICNTMKGALSAAAFKQHLKKIIAQLDGLPL